MHLIDFNRTLRYPNLMLNETREWFVADEEGKMFELLYETFGESRDRLFAETSARNVYRDHFKELISPGNQQR